MKIGIDIGGTKIEGVVLDSDGRTIKRERISTESEKGYDHILHQIKTLYSQLTSDVSLISSVGVCTPGVLSSDSDMLKNSNTQCLIGKPIKKDIESFVGTEINIENDANCFAQAEAILGAGKGYNVVFGVIMGTGVGGGIVFIGNVHKGTHSIAGEWGHSILHPGGNMCYCGKHGCVEQYLSGPALEKSYTELTGNKKPLKEISTNPPQEWKLVFLENFAMALSNVINILDPDIIVLGGGVSNIDFLYTEGASSVEKFCFNNSLNTPIVKNKLGDSAGVFGAAYL